MQVRDAQELTKLQADFVQAQMQAMIKQAKNLSDTATKAAPDKLKTQLCRPNYRRQARRQFNLAAVCVLRAWYDLVSCYSLAALRDSAVRRAAWDRHHDRWEGLKITFASLAQGEKRLGLPALDGLSA